MKIEKISETKLKIVLTLDELNKRNISIKELKTNTKKAKQVFSKILDELYIDDFFDDENNQILVEAMMTESSLFIIFVTKINQIPNLEDYNLLSTTNSLNILPIFYIFEFKNITILKEFINILNNILQDTQIKYKNSLYYLNNSYYILFNHSILKNKNFYKCYNILTEYALEMSNSKELEYILNEKGTILIKDNAIQKLLAL